MLGSLADHFGEDASLPDDKIEIIRNYLTSNAGDAINRGWAAKYMPHDDVTDATAGWRMAASHSAAIDRATVTPFSASSM